MTDDRPPLRPTIRNAVIHLNNEQPLLADLFDVPRPHDLGLLCTNLRTMNGKAPVFADHSASTFFFPYQHVRFLEIHPAADAPPVATPEASATDASVIEPDADLELDEDFLRRIREV
jgi:hypothetical protein